MWDKREVLMIRFTEQTSAVYCPTLLRAVTMLFMKFLNTIISEFYYMQKSRMRRDEKKDENTLHFDNFCLKVVYSMCLK